MKRHGQTLYSSFCLLHSECGELDQSTELSLINSFRWVQLPPPLPVFARYAVAGEGCRVEAQYAKTDLIKSESGLRLGMPINLGERSGCPSVKRVSQNRIGRDDWGVTRASHQPSPATQERAKAAATEFLSFRNGGGPMLHLPCGRRLGVPGGFYLRLSFFVRALNFIIGRLVLLTTR